MTAATPTTAHARPPLLHVPHARSATAASAALARRAGVSPADRRSASPSASLGAVSPAASDASMSSLIPIVAPSYTSPAPGTISFFEPVASSSSSEHDADDHRVVRKKPRKKRTGWGPYQSVLKERSVDFNLTLDVQNLKQEIKTMEMMRDILASKTMIQRHDPEGSLVRMAKEHYRVLRSGFNVSESGRKRALKEQDQVSWIRSVFDPNVDVGNGAYGVDMVIEQIKLYSVFINFISMTMTSFEVIVAEDSVLIATRGIMHFQITRTTIASMFPHIMSQEWLVAKLVGQEIHAETTMDFYFNTQDKVCKFQPNLDYVKTFIDILKDPRDVAILLGRALITDNCMIGLTNDDLPPPKSPATSASRESSAAPAGLASLDDSPFEAAAPSAAADDDAAALAAAAVVSQPSSSNSGCTSGASSNEVAPSHQSTISDPSGTRSKSQATKPKKAIATRPTIAVATAPSTSTSPPPMRNEACQPQAGPLTPTDHFCDVVKQYFRMFESGSDSAVAVSDLQHSYLVQHFSPTVGYGSVVGRQVVEDRWRSLCWCFGALSFRQLTQEPLAYTPMENLYLIQCAAEYTMGVTVRTVEQVFPHVFADPALMDIFVGSTLTVPAQLTFWLEKDTGLVASITEQMDFDSALRRVVKRPDDLSFVLSRALPTLCGFVGEVVESNAQADAPAATPTSAAARSSDKHKTAQRGAVPASPASPSLSASFPDTSAPGSKAKMRLSNILG